MTPRLLTISFSLFLVSAMMGTFPIPGTNSVSVPSNATLEAPSSSPSISIASGTTAVAETGTTTPPTDTLASKMTESINAPSNESVNSFRMKDLHLNSEDPLLLLPKAASSGLYRASVSPLTFKQPGEWPPQKRAASTESQQQQQQKWSPPQGQGQQWYPSQGQQGQQWYQQGQQWYQQGQGRGQQIDNPYYTFQKRNIIPTFTAAPQGGSPPPYHMSALVCNQDTRARGLIHCSDNKDYYTLEQPSNPANLADPRNRPWPSPSPVGQTATSAGPAAAILWKRTVAPQGANILTAPPGGVGALGSDSQGWFRRPQPYAAQPKGQTPQISKRQAGAGAAAAAIHQHGGSASSENFDLGNLSKWSGSGYTGGAGGGSDWVGKGGSSGYGKKWKRAVQDEGNLNKWSGSGAGSGYGGSGGGGGDDWSHWGKGDKGGKGGKKWNKRQAPGAYGRGGNTAVVPVPIDIGLVWDGSNVNMVPPPSSRTVSPGGPGGPGGMPADSIVVGADFPPIPVPINVDALVYPDGQMQIFPSNPRN